MSRFSRTRRRAWMMLLDALEFLALALVGLVVLTIAIALLGVLVFGVGKVAELGAP